MQFKLDDFTENISLRISSENGDGTLELEEAVPALKLFILATSGNGNSTFTGTIHFSDGSTQEITSQTVNDWYNSPSNIAIAGVGRVSRADGSVDNNTSNPKLFQIEINIEEENQEKEITQISFVKTSADGYLNIFGMSREFVADCPKPTGIEAENITSNSADINWNEAAEDTTWTFIYGEAGFNPEDEGTSTEVEDSTFHIEDLLPNTNYEVYIQAHCSDTEDSNMAGPFGFTTACGPKDVPYIQDFETAIVPNIPNCNAVETISGGNEWETKTQNDVYNIPSGFDGQVLVFPYTFSGQANAWFFTEGINLEAGVNYEISYKYANNSTNYEEKMKVSFGSSQDANAMTTDLADYPNINDAQIHEEEIIFTVEEDGVYYFGFQAYSAQNQYNIIVDDIEITVAAGCAKPGDLNAENITETSADINWTSFNNEDEWTLVYGEQSSDFDPETDGTSITVTDNNEFSLEDLTTNTTYNVFVKAICGENDESSWTNALTFTTSCEIMDLPYFEDFNEVSTPALPDCTSTETNTGNTWRTTNSPISSGNALNYSYHLSQEANTWFFSPGLNLEAGVNYQISYKYGNSGTYPESLKVAYGTDNSSAEMENELADHPNFTGSHEKEVVFSVDEDGVYFFGFKAYSDADQNQLYVDDIEIKVAPTCIEPTDIVISTSSNTADISWTPQGDAEEWELIYGAIGFDPETEGTSVIVENDPETTLTDLDPATSYEVYIKTICSEDDQSEWSESAEFTTACVATTVPFLQDFENVNVPEIPICATVENAGSGNNWITYDPSAPNSWTGANGFDGKVLSY